MMLEEGHTALPARQLAGRLWQRALQLCRLLLEGSAGGVCAAAVPRALLAPLLESLCPALLPPLEERAQAAVHAVLHLQAEEEEGGSAAAAPACPVGLQLLAQLISPSLGHADEGIQAEALRVQRCWRSPSAALLLQLPLWAC
jgi:hypothetical protein